MKLNIIENLLTRNDCYNSGRTITPIGMQLHTIGTGQNTASSLASYWNQPGIECCVHYCVDAETEGRVLHFLPDNRRSWADGGGVGNSSLITVELMESDYIGYTGGANYVVYNQEKFKADIMRAYNTAVQLFAKICKDHNWDPTAKLPNGLHVVSSHDEGRRLGLSSAHVDPTHVWDRFGLNMDQFRKDVKAAMGMPVEEPAKKSGTQYTDIKNLSSDSEKALALLEVVKPIAQKYKLLPSVIAAQAILESGFCSTELSKSNNICGMKCNLVNSMWSGSTWDGTSKVPIYTPEYYNGVKTMITDYFRVYPCLEDCIADICAFFTTMEKYVKGGVIGCTDYRTQITIESKNGYATDPAYIEKVCNIIQRYGLNKYDNEAVSTTATTKKKPYGIQCGYFAVKENASYLKKQLKDAGFGARIVKKGNGYIVRCGVYQFKANAQKKINKLKAKGFPALIYNR